MIDDERFNLRSSFLTDLFEFNHVNIQSLNVRTLLEDLRASMGSCFVLELLQYDFLGKFFNQPLTLHECHLNIFRVLELL